jgi:hypothetical protein
VIRIPMPPDSHGVFPNTGGDYRTYTNSVFVNNTIILPLYDPQYDSTALRIYREAMPGYTVTGIDCNSIIPSLGAIHCITKEIAAADPLLISHQQLHDTDNTVGPYLLHALIQHRSGIQSATLYYRTDTIQSWQAVAMTNVSGNDWSSAIPPQPAGTTVYYYLEATSVSGKTQVRPMPAPAGYFRFSILLNTGIQNDAQVLSLATVFPNPSHGLTCIPVSGNSHQLRLTLKNILGEEVRMIYDGTSSGERKYFMNTSDLVAGVYVIEAIADGRREVQKIIVR